jgi:CspA family cold shock protein
MNFKDTMQTCEKCGQNFVFTVEEQRRLHKVGKEDYIPKLCPTCREINEINEINEEGESVSRIKLIGHVKWYNALKGYGFITKADRSEIFVHRTGLVAGVRDLVDGQKVEFDVRQTDKGPEAYNVAPIGE